MLFRCLRCRCPSSLTSKLDRRKLRHVKSFSNHSYVCMYGDAGLTIVACPASVPPLVVTASEPAFGGTGIAVRGRGTYTLDISNACFKKADGAIYREDKRHQDSSSSVLLTTVELEETSD